MSLYSLQEHELVLPNIRIHNHLTQQYKWVSASLKTRLLFGTILEDHDLNSIFFYGVMPQ